MEGLEDDDMDGVGDGGDAEPLSLAQRLNLNGTAKPKKTAAAKKDGPAKPRKPKSKQLECNCFIFRSEFNLLLISVEINYHCTKLI